MRKTPNLKPRPYSEGKFQTSRPETEPKFSNLSSRDMKDITLKQLLLHFSK